MMLSFEKIFASADKEVQRRRRLAYGRIHLILAGCYFTQRDIKQFFKHAARSVSYDPRNIAYFAAYPLRLASRAASALRPVRGGRVD